jgi:hypothetical protein
MAQIIDTFTDAIAKEKKDKARIRPATEYDGAKVKLSMFLMELNIWTK